MDPIDRIPVSTATLAQADVAFNLGQLLSSEERDSNETIMGQLEELCADLTAQSMLQGTKKIKLLVTLIVDLDPSKLEEIAMQRNIALRVLAICHLAMLHCFSEVDITAKGGDGRNLTNAPALTQALEGGGRSFLRDRPEAEGHVTLAGKMLSSLPNK